MKKQNEVILKYKTIFGQEKEYLDILKECHEKMIDFKDKTFTLLDFKNDEEYQGNLLFINEFRKYAKMDDFLLGVSDYSLIPLSDANHLSQKITYHDIMEAIDLFDEQFLEMKSFYIRKSRENTNPTLGFTKVLTVNDIFNYRNDNQFTIYFIESSEKYCFGAIYESYEYIHYLPFNKINLDKEDTQNSIIYGYLYLTQEYLLNNYKEIVKDKVYTTLYKEYGVTYEEYLKKPNKGQFVVYNNNLKDFLIEPEGLTYYPRLNLLRFDVLDIFKDKQEQFKDFFLYFKGLGFDKNKAEDYVRKNWILNKDIGRVYGIEYNLVGTKKELEEYKEKIIQQKLADIELNFHMYKKHGLAKYNQEDVKGILKDGYTSHIKEYISSFETTKKDFNTEQDKRIDLDKHPIFRIGKSEHLDYRHFAHSLKHPNIVMSDYLVFGEVKKRVIIQVQLEKFINAYNQFKKSEVLEMNYDWYFPYKQLHDYVDNTVQSFCHIQHTSGVRTEEFKVLRDIFFYEGEDRKKILDHPDFIEDTKKYHILSRNPYYFEIPVILELHMDLKEFEKIQKGTHPIFKSEHSEKLKHEDALKLESSERFLSKSEIVSQSNYDVVYTSRTNKSSNLHKGIKGKIVSVDKEIVIEDELGNIHTESFRSVKKSGWKHVSTMDYDKLYSSLSLSEKAFLESKDRKLLN